MVGLFVSMSLCGLHSWVNNVRLVICRGGLTHQVFWIGPGLGDFHMLGMFLYVSSYVELD